MDGGTEPVMDGGQDAAPAGAESPRRPKAPERRRARIRPRVPFRSRPPVAIAPADRLLAAARRSRAVAAGILRVPGPPPMREPEAGSAQWETDSYGVY